MKGIERSARRAGCGVLALALAACSQTGTGDAPPAEAARETPAPAPAEADGGAIEAHAAFMKALRGADVEALAGMLEASTELLVFHPRVVSRFDGIEEARRGYERMFARLGTAEWTEVHTAARRQGDVAWLSYHVAVEAASLPEPFLGRATEIWVRGTGGWKLAHGHWSAIPGRP